MKMVSDSSSSLYNIRPVAPGQLGNTLIIAPHPDDETLGCGGTAALLHRKGYQVHYLIVSDGSMSHPNSLHFPASKLAELRKQEAIGAVKVLGGNEDDVYFMGLKDGSVPHITENQVFKDAVERTVQLLDKLRPATIMVPWRNDPHPDHQATWEITMAAIRRIAFKTRVLEYPVWFWERGESEDLEVMHKMKRWSIDVAKMLPTKMKALACHVSQVTRLIDDDAEGFMLSPEVISHFNRPIELFFEQRQHAKI